QNARGAFRVMQGQLEGAVARVPVGRLLGHCPVVGTKNGSRAVDDRSRRRRVHTVLAEWTASSAPGRDLAGLADAETHGGVTRVRLFDHEDVVTAGTNVAGRCDHDWCRLALDRNHE